MLWANPVSPVTGADEAVFIDNSISGGAVTAYDAAGAPVNVQVRWAKISNADANIDTVSMERPDGGDVLAMFFSVQVRDRRHLAHVMRALRRVASVKRVQHFFS